MAVASLPLCHPVILHLDVDSFEIQANFPKSNLTDQIVAINSKRLILSATQSARKLPEIRRRATLDVKKARRLHPQLLILEVPTDEYGKPESQKKRRAGFDLLKLTKQFAQQKNAEIVIESNSSDEMFIDVSVLAAQLVLNNQEIKTAIATMVQWRSHSGLHVEEEDEVMHYVIKELLGMLKKGQIPTADQNLFFGGLIALELQQEILMKSKYRGLQVSIGISSNKTLAKIATTLHRPYGVTVLPFSGFQRVAKTVHASKITGLGNNDKLTVKNFFSEFGQDLTITQLQELPPEALSRHLGAQKALLVRDRARGDDMEPVVQKFMNRTLCCSKTVDEKDMEGGQTVHDVIRRLCTEMIDRNVNEEALYNDRVGSKFKLELKSAFGGPGPDGVDYSSSVSIDEPDALHLMDGPDLALELTANLFLKGYHLQALFEKVTVSVLKWGEVGPKTKATAELHNRFRLIDEGDFSLERELKKLKLE